MITRWLDFSAAHPWRIMTVAALVALLGGVGTARLYGDLRPDISELLPSQARSVRDLQIISGRVGGWAADTVIIHGASPEAMRRFAVDLAAALQVHIPTLVRRVDFRDDMAFFYARRWLFPSLTDLQDVLRRIRARLDWEAQHANPLFVSLDDDDKPPDFDDLRARFEKLGGNAKRFDDGFFAGEVDGAQPGTRQEIVVLLVRMAGTAEDFDKVKQVDAAVRATIAKLDPTKYAAGMQVAFSGDVASAIVEHDALTEDLSLATSLVILVVALSLALYYRTWRAVFIVGLPLVVGTTATFGVAYLAVGHLNSNTAFLGSIVIGNGINVGLVLFARYVEERRGQKTPIAAMRVAFLDTYQATLTASLAAGISYASLMSTQSRGFSQFGLVGGVGMALCWVAAYAVMPAVCLAWERRDALVRPTAQGASRSAWTTWLVGLVERGPRRILLASTVLLTVAIAYFPGFVRDPFELDFSHLRNQQAMLPGNPGWWDERVDALFGDHLTPTVMICRDAEEAQQVTGSVIAARDANPETTLGTVVSVATLLPAEQPEKLAVLGEIRSALAPENIRWIPASARAQLAALIPPANLTSFAASDLPVAVRAQLTETDGHFGTMVLLYPKSTVNVWDGRDVLRFASEIRSLPLPRPDIPTAGSILVFADMLTAMQNDGPQATLLSLAGVCALVIVMFRGQGRRAATNRPRHDAARVLVTLALGIVWFVGLAAALGLKINMLNFIAFPITFGIGADYATNLLQRRRVDPKQSIADCLATTGGAVALCSWTTIVGYGSLLVARNQALASFGVLAVLGEMACLVAALGTLPAWLQFRRRPASDVG